MTKDGHFVLQGPRGLGRLAEGAELQLRAEAPDAARAGRRGAHPAVRPPEPAYSAAFAELMLATGSGAWEDEAGPDAPSRALRERPAAWTAQAWEMYSAAYEVVSPLRRGHGNTVSTLIGLGVGPNNCVLKLVYTLFSEPGEDDYPYMPAGCGPGFDFRVGGGVRRALPPSALLASLVLALGLRAG